ncbi:MAG: glycosyltransferase [Polyangiaceae bacterium]
METVALGLARGLLDRGVDVRVYTADRLGARVASGLPEGVVRPVFEPRPGARRIDLRADLLATITAAAADEPDVIHLCHAGLAPWVPALRAAVASGITVHVHGNDLLAPWVHHEEPLERYERSVVEGLRAADRVVAVSRFSRGLAVARGVARDRIAVIENGVDVERFHPGPRDEALARRLGLEPADEVVLSVSRLAARKGHRTVIAAISALARARPRLRFVFTGENAALARDLLALADELGVRDRVVATGFLPADELPALHRLADVFVLAPDTRSPDDVEGFGVALLEAAASGVPTVGARIGGVPEAMEGGVTGLLVEPGASDELARTLDAILSNPELARRLGAAGRARAVARFDESRVTADALALWSSIASRPFALDRGADPHGELVELARADRARRVEARARRRREIAAAHARGRVVRLRATSDGACKLPAALDDCAALGVAPRVEVKLRRFLEPDFAAYASPRIESVELVHGVPHGDSAADAEALLDRVRGARTRLSKVRTLRLFLTPEARRDPALALRAVPEVHALRAVFREAGALVAPPHELMRYLSETPAGGPETAMIEPTNLCNLACPTCPTGTGKIAPLPAMSVEKFARALRELGPRVRNLALWNYGEPLLNKHLPEMIAHAKGAGVQVVKVSSNVHFLDGERGRALLASGLDVLILSVDGASQATYATFRRDGDFERVAGAVAWLTSEKRRLGLAKPRIELQFIAMRHNQHEIPEMRRLAREWGVDKLRIKTVGADDPETRDLIPTDRLLSRYDATASRPNTRHALCTMPWDHAVINVDGSVTPCCYLRPDMGDAFVMGNVFETTFAEIWRGPKYRAFRRGMLEGRANMPVCDRCRGGTHDLLAAVEEVERA